MTGPLVLLIALPLLLLLTAVVLTLLNTSQCQSQLITCRTSGYWRSTSPAPAPEISTTPDTSTIGLPVRT